MRKRKNRKDKWKMVIKRLIKCKIVENQGKKRKLGVSIYILREGKISFSDKTTFTGLNKKDLDAGQRWVFR
jgi:hypothetical protein